MAAKTLFYADAILQAVLNAGSITGAASVYLALNTTTSTSSTPGTEVADVTYTRLTIGWSGSSGGVDTGAAIGSAGNFFGVGATAGPYTIVEIAIYDAPTAGNELYFASITPVTVNPTDTTSLTATSVTVTETGKPNSLIDALSNAILSAGAYNGPATTYTALMTTTSSPTSPGTEVVDANYARISLTWNGGVAGSNHNTSAPSFFGGSGVATGPYTIVEVAVFDAPTGGNELYYGSLGTPRTLGAGDKSSIPATTGLVVTES